MTALNENESLPMDERYTNVSGEEERKTNASNNTEEIQGAQRATLEPRAHLGHIPSAVTLPSAHLFYTTPTAHPRGNESEPFTQSPFPGAQVQMNLVDLQWSGLLASSSRSIPNQTRLQTLSTILNEALDMLDDAEADFAWLTDDDVSMAAFPGL